MKITAQMLAELLGGETVGDPETVVTGPARIEQAKDGDVCFFANPKYEKYVYDTKASVLLVSKDFVPARPVRATLIKVENVYESVSVLLDFFNRLRRSRKRGNRLWARISLRRSIALTARVGKGTHIYPLVYLGPHVKVGKNCILYPGVRVYHDCVIGDNCILHAGAVIGADGFGFAPLADGTYQKIEQIGNVVLEDDVEIGANTTIDRSAMGSTVIHKGVKLDNLVHIAHNVEVGANTVMAALCGVAGSTKIGENCVFGGQSGTVGHIELPDHTTVAAKTGVIATVKKSGMTLVGFPALEYGTYMRAYAKFRRSGSPEKQ